MSPPKKRSTSPAPRRADKAGLQPYDAKRQVPLRVGFVLLNQFTLAGFAGLVEALRLAADHGGRSRQIYASWAIMSEDGKPCRSSCGAVLSETSNFMPPASFDYVAICGGNDYLQGATQSPKLLKYLRAVNTANVRLIGVCTGTFALAKAGLIGRRTVCINWNVLSTFQAMFPQVTARADSLFIDEGDIITCAGSTAAIDLGLYLIARHCGGDKARQAQRHMILQEARPARLPQPHFYAELNAAADVRVRQAVHFMEQRIDAPPSIDATANYVGISPRQLERLFRDTLDISPKTFQIRLRLKYGEWLLVNSQRTIMQIAFDCGFADAAHFSREFRAFYASKPSDVRRLHRA